MQKKRKKRRGQASHGARYQGAGESRRQGSGAKKRQNARARGARSKRRARRDAARAILAVACAAAVLVPIAGAASAVLPEHRVEERGVEHHYGMLFTGSSEDAPPKTEEAGEAVAGDYDEDVPESILEFVEKYPEAAPFAEEYSEKKDLHPDIDVSGEVEKGVIPLFIQWDGRWGYETYGTGFLGVTGCGPTCISMVACGLTGDASLDPLTVARFSDRQGYFVPGEGTSWSLMTEGAEMLGLSATGIAVKEETIMDVLSKEGKAIICSVYPGDFTYSGHFIVLAGLGEDGSSVAVRDPNSPGNSERLWSMDELLPQIRAAWAYEEAPKVEVDIVKST